LGEMSESPSAAAESKPVEPVGLASDRSATAASGSDEDLAARAVDGDAAAYEELVRRYQDRVFGMLVRLTGSENEAEDLAQETFLKAYRALGSFRRGSKFYTWLFRIAVNTGYSRGRQIVRRQRVEGVSLDAPVAGNEGAEDATTWGGRLAGASQSPAERMDQDFVRERVQEGLAQLDPEYRAVILLRDMEGLDYEQIAEALSISRAAVKSRLHRARLELGRLLKDLRPD
jgi:RNA polymerase sigma-70 factor (ECF subfamily)